MKTPFRRGTIPSRGLLIVALMLGLFVGSLGVWAREQTAAPKASTNPDVGLSDLERTARIDKLKARNTAWVREFSASKRDPRSLPLEVLEAFSTGAATPSEAWDSADLLVEGVVKEVSYDSPGGVLTESRAVVAVQRAFKGELPAEVIVFQNGGPAWNERGGALQQLEGDHLLLPGQHVFVLLRAAAPREGYYTVYGAGVYLVTPDGLRAPDSNAFAGRINGLSVEAALAVLR